MWQPSLTPPWTRPALSSWKNWLPYNKPGNNKCRLASPPLGHCHPIATLPASLRLDQPFPPDRLADIYREVERLTLRLLTRRALRSRQAHHGRLDLRRTVSQSLRNGSEVPFILVRRRRKVNKLRLMVLCDVSGSVWQVSTFLLKLVHTLQSEFANVRSFVFVNSLVEITDLFRHMRFPEDLEALRHYPNLNLFGFTISGVPSFSSLSSISAILHATPWS